MSETYFAPARRATPLEVKRLSQEVSSDDVLMSVLEGIPGIAFILNSERQIVGTNHTTLESFHVNVAEEIYGKRIGEVVGCMHVDGAPGGCGTAEACALCGAGTAVVESQDIGGLVRRECRITVSSGRFEALDLEVVANQIKVADDLLTVCTMRDISGDKRRRVLERVFFHDVMNTAGGLKGIAYFLAESDGSDPEADVEFKEMMRDLTERLVEEITGQRQLLAAESGDLETRRTSVVVSDVLQEVRDLLSKHSVADGRNIDLSECEEDMTAMTDPGLLRRVLVNMVKNALEATPTGGTVAFGCTKESGQLVFSVNNPTVMPREVQLQVFKRSFSTKGESGRGIGTYSMKVFGEHYLGGKIDFVSQEPEGTTFFLSLPANQIVS
jgi:signal transduction histidine kinase